MNSFERDLHDALSSNGEFDPQGNDAARKEAIKTYDVKLKRARILTWVFLAFLAVVMAYLAILFVITNNMKIMLACVVAFLIAHAGTNLMKLWYWQMNTKFSVLKELKELELRVVELSEKVSPSEQ